MKIILTGEEVLNIVRDYLEETMNIESGKLSINEQYEDMGSVGYRELYSVAVILESDQVLE